MNAISTDQDPILDRQLLAALVQAMDSERGLYQDAPNPLLVDAAATADDVRVIGMGC